MANVLVTGATGFTGRHVVRRLAEAGHRVTAFVRPSSQVHPIASLVQAVAMGDLNRPESLRAALEGHDALVNIASIGFGHAPGIAAAALQASVKRALYFSTTALFTTLPATSRAVRQQAEETIRASKTPWTIVRPTMIYGDSGDRNLIRLIQWVDRCKVIPVFGPGTYLLQPVYADDLARAVVAALDRDVAAGKIYNLSGGTAITYNDLVGLVGELLGRRPYLIHLPVPVALVLVDIARRLPLGLKFSREQVLRLNEDKAFAHDEAAHDLDYRPLPLREGLTREVRLYKETHGDEPGNPHVVLSTAPRRADRQILGEDG